MKFITEIQAKYQMIRRMIFWGWNLRNSWDFDAQTIYHVLHLKLQRHYNCFRDNGHLMWNSDVDNKGMRQLSEAIILCDRLKGEYHEDIAFAELEETFGKLTFEFIPLNDEFSKMESSRPKVVTEEDKKQYSKHLRRIFKKAGEQRKQDEERFFFLLRKNIRQWWD